MYAKCDTVDMGMSKWERYRIRGGAAVPPSQLRTMCQNLRMFSYIPAQRCLFIKMYPKHRSTEIPRVSKDLRTEAVFVVRCAHDRLNPPPRYPFDRHPKRKLRARYIRRITLRTSRKSRNVSLMNIVLLYEYSCGAVSLLSNIKVPSTFY